MSVFVLCSVLFIGLVNSASAQDAPDEAPKAEAPMNEAAPAPKAEMSAPYNGLVLTLNDQWSLKFSGQLNTYFVANMQEGKDAIFGVQNGLLPASLNVSPMFKASSAVTISGNFGLYLGIPASGVDNSKSNVALDFSAVDIRSLSFSIATPGGTFFLGRDFGQFGLDAILNDISLLGVGGNYSFANPQHTTLGGIGYGYIYADRLVQINYTTPTFGNTSVTVGIYDAINDFGATSIATGIIGWHAKAKTDQKFGENVGLYISATFLAQYRSVLSGMAIGWDAFLKFNVYGFSLIGYIYGGDGIGDVGLMVGGTKTNGSGKVVAASSLGYYGQLSYTIKMAMPLTIGVFYGASTIDQGTGGKSDVKASTRITGSVALAVLPYLILRAEFTNQSEQKTLPAAAPKANIVNVGATFAF
ncbi:hypothetical protein CHS0354_024048 [Potamilus streckersoni]|uniref:Porin n=1 Tax=Potamilus streckersoni TaxID=2493646 RepID=A0AAE0RZC2_9BIVA|nr:hypothetical protein CHS0354_024048 [Potamilus streckersoni]